MQRPQQRALITLGSTFGALAIGALVSGFVVIRSDLGIGLWLVVLGSALFIAATTCFVMLIVLDRMPRRALTTGQQSNLIAYLRVSRYTRGGIQAALGMALVVLGIVVVITGQSGGFWFVGLGVLLAPLGGLNIWLATRLGRNTGAETDGRLGPPPSI